MIGPHYEQAVDHPPDDAIHPSDNTLVGALVRINVEGKCESYIGSFANPHRILMEGLSGLFIAHAAQSSLSGTAEPKRRKSRQ